MVTAQELKDKYGPDTEVVTVKSGAYNVNVAVRDYGDGILRVADVSTTQARPAILSHEWFLNVSDVPMAFDTTDLNEVRQIIGDQL